MEEGDSSPLKALLDSKGYTFVKELGSGGSATCHLVLSRQYRELFCVKVLSLTRHQVCKQCELSALRQLSCPNVIYLYDFVSTPDSLCLFLEFCPGGSLADYVRKNGHLQGKKLYGVLKNVLNGLAYIHEHRYAHLDLKPGNVLIDRFGRPKLADFGISHQYMHDDGEIFQRAGTLLYMAPEIFKPNPYDGFRVDVWAFGVLCAAVAFGAIPWSAQTPESLKMAQAQGLVSLPRQCDPGLKEVIVRSLDPEPKNRPTAAELLAHPLFQDVDVKDGNLMPSERRASMEDSRGGRASAMKFRIGIPIIRPKQGAGAVCALSQTH